MSRRTSIVKALTEKLKNIDGSGSYNTNVHGAVYPTLKFWDECNNFPSIYVVAGNESREYHPSSFTWGYLGIALKIYTKGEDAQQLLENLLEDVENVIDANRQLVYDAAKNYSTTEILISSIITDEGQLVPYAIGEINLQVRYAIM
jgi:hypothetical protein